MQLAFTKTLDTLRDTLDNLRDILDNLRDTLEWFREPSTKLPPGGRPYDLPVLSEMTINYLHVRDDANLVTSGDLRTCTNTYRGTRTSAIRFRNTSNVLRPRERSRSSRT